MAKRKWYRNPDIVKRTPIVTLLLSEGANLGHLMRMWTHQSASGHNPLSWVLVVSSLLLWYNYYCTIAPETQGYARAAVRVALCTTSAILLSVLYLQVWT